MLRLRSFETAGLDLVVITDHNRVSDLSPAFETMPWSTVHAIAGTEGRIGDTKAIGHLTAFPLTPGLDLPKHSGDVGSLIDGYRSEGSDTVLQLCHPRGIQFRIADETSTKAHGLFSHKTYKRRRAPGVGPNAWMTEAQPGTGTTPLDFDLIEVMNRFSYDVWLRVRRDWFALMDHGYFLTGTGNSDSHALAVEQVGVPINLVQVGSVAPSDLEDAFVEAMVHGRVVVSMGPIVGLRVTADGGEGGPGDLVSGGRAHAQVTVQAAPWVPVPEVRLVVDGEVVQRVEVMDADRESDGTLAVEYSWPVEPGAADSWVLAEAGWPLDDHERFPPAVPGLFAEIVRGAAPVGFTNPVRIDRDGDGVFEPSKGARWRASGGCAGD